MKKLLPILFLFAGCKSAEQLYNKAKDKDPVKVAGMARNDWPCTTTSIETKNDSAAFKAWQDSVQQIRSFYEELLNNVVPDIVHDTTKIVDSVTCNDLLVKYRENDKKHIEKESILARQVSELNNKLKSIPPVNNNTVKTVEDSAKIFILQAQAAKDGQTIEKLNGTIKSRGTIIKWLIFLLIGFSIPYIIKLISLWR